VQRILIVDDERAIRGLLSTALGRAGYDVQTAADGSEAMGLCTSQPFDLVLSDVMIPSINGHELARWVAVHFPATRTALMSGFDVSCQRCVHSPRCRLLPKPFKVNDVVSFVGQVLAAPPCSGD
jgi:CheY-like chemotaxis protein